MKSQGKQQADLLAELLATIRSGAHASQFVVVEGERGIGKTHVCQTLYRELAALQPAPPFWPLDLRAPGPSRREYDRNTTRPARFSIAAGAQPSFAWLGLNCGRQRDGLTYNPLALASKQVTVLRDAIEDAMRIEDTSVSRTILLDLLEIATAFASIADVARTPLLEAGLAARTAAHAAHEIADAHGARARRRRQRDQGRDVDETLPDPELVRSYCNLLSGLAEDLELPTVLLLDDFQLADPTLLRLLDSLPDQVPRNLTVLCTADSAALEAQRLDARAQTPGPWLESRAADAFTRVELAPLAPSVLAGVVRAAAPGTADDTVNAFVQRSRGNPYRLRLMLDAPRAQAGDGRIALTASEVLALPDRFEALYAAEWLELPAPSQRAVAIASMFGRAIPRDLLETACLSSAIADARDAIAAAQRSQWLIAPTHDTLAFPDESRREVAITQSGEADVLDDQERARIGEEALELAVEAMRDQLAAWTAAPPLTSLPQVPESTVPTLETIVVLAGDHAGGTPDEIAMLTMIFGAFLTRRGAHLQAAEHAKRVGRGLASRGAAQLGVLLEIKAAEWWSDAGRQEHAWRQLEEIASHYSAEQLAEREAERLRTFVAGETLTRQGHAAQGIHLLKRLAADPHDEDGLGHRSSMTITNVSLGRGDLSTAAAEVNRRYASMLAEQGSEPWWRQEAECAELRELIQLHELRSVNAARAAASYPPELGAAGELRQDAQMWFARGCWLTALAVNVDLANGLMAVHPDHSFTLAIRGDGAEYRSLLGEHEEAVAELEDVLEAYKHAGHVDGPGPDTFVTHGMHAQALSRIGRHDEALAELNEARSQAAEDLGPRHTVVTALEAGMAFVLARAGADDDARVVYADVVARYEANLDPRDPVYRAARRRLARLEVFRKQPARKALSDPVRSSARTAADGWSARRYQQGQDEDWALLFGTAGRRTRLKRTLIARSMNGLLRANVRD
ncbi:MAG TPA: hypothetical protein VFF79_18955 [Conexibacter sp.]|nr:hypothetical protein [Conexibacter sp.]